MPKFNERVFWSLEPRSINTEDGRYGPPITDPARETRVVKFGHPSFEFAATITLHGNDEQVRNGAVYFSRVQAILQAVDHADATVEDVRKALNLMNDMLAYFTTWSHPHKAVLAAQHNKLRDEFHALQAKRDDEHQAGVLAGDGVVGN